MLLYELVTQEFPYAHVDFLDVPSIIAMGEVPAVPPQRDHSIGALFATLMGMCWQEPDKRPTPTQLLVLLDEFAETFAMG